MARMPIILFLANAILLPGFAGAVSEKDFEVGKKSIDSTRVEMSSGPPELDPKVVDRINAAAEMGDVMQIQSIAEELKSESDAVAPFCDNLIRLAEDFDFEGIQKIVLELAS